MKYSEDAQLQAAATILAAQITAETFSVDMGDEENVASGLEAALRAVSAGLKRAVVKPAKGGFD